MPPQPPRKLDDAAVDRRADIASIQRRDIFDPGLTDLVTAACRWHEERQQVASERAEIVRAGRVFASKIAKTSPLVRQQLDLAFPDDGATAWLNATLDGIAPSSPRARLSKWNSNQSS